MAFTSQEEAQLRLIMLSFLSGKAIADLENADPETIAGALIEVVQNGVSRKTSIAEFFTGSPAGVKASLTALQTEFPGGAPGIYVASDNGHWYYWDGTAWTDGGLYKEIISTVNNLVTTDAGYALDARQGKTLNDAIALKENAANKKTIINDSDTEFPTSKAVKTALDAKMGTVNVANNLTTTSEGSVLDARQGKVLNDAIALKENAANKKTIINDSDTEFPTSKAVRTEFIGTNRTLAEVLSTLDARILSLETFIKGNLGDVTVNTINIIKGVNQYGSDGNAELKASGAPAAIPDYIGQQYTDTANGNIYKAKNNTAVSDWVKIN